MNNKPIEYNHRIDYLLENIDLSFDNYIPSEEALEFWTLARLIKGEDFEVGNPLLHYWLVDLVFGNITQDQYPYTPEARKGIKLNKRKVAIMCSRGLAKSTTITLFLVLYMAIKGRLPGLGKVGFVLGIGDSQEAGAKVQCNTIRDTIEESLFLQDYFESVRCTDQEIEIVRKGTGPESKRSFMFKAKGAQGGIRGIRYKGERIDVILADDIVKNEQDAHSTVIMKAIKNTVYSDAINALKGQGGKVVLIGTPMNLNDVVMEAITSTAWSPVVIPICEKIDENLKESEFVGAWPEMHSYDRVMERYLDAKNSGATRAFNQELMLSITSDEDRMIKDDMIQWYKRADLTERLHNFNLYITTDFTTTEGPKSDFSALAVWALGANKDYFLLDMCVRRHGIQEQYDELFRMVSYWGKGGRSIEVGIETDGQQKSHIFSLKEMMRKRNVWFTVARQKGAPFGKEGILSRSAGGSKFERFKYMMPQIQDKKFWFPEEVKDTIDMKEAMQQMKYTSWTGFGSKDDWMDCISQLGMMNLLFPIQEDTIPRKNSGIGNSIDDRMWGSELDDPEPDAYESY